MKADVLIALTSPQGVPFDGNGPTLRERMDQVCWFKSGKSVDGTYLDGKVRWNLPKGDHQTRRAFWTAAEAGMAAQGLDERYFHAIRFQFALDNSVFYSLKLHLLKYAIREKKLQGWPDTLARERGRYIRRVWFTVKDANGKAIYTEQKYLEDLVTMLLCEVRYPSWFIREVRQPDPKRIAMGVTHEIWKRKLTEIYETIVDEHRRWIAVGCAHMNRRLRNPALDAAV
jgi:hypothetical protein